MSSHSFPPIHFQYAPEPGLISVIMPAYNAGPYVAEAIASVLSQTYTNFELIVVDDNSKDNTAEEIHRFTDSRIRYEKTTGIGCPAGVRNLGFTLSKGSYIAFLDADDKFYPDALELLLNAFNQNPGTLAAHGFAGFMEPDGTPMAPTMYGLSLEPKEDGSGYDFPKNFPLSWEMLIKGHFHCMLPCLMLSREGMEVIGPLNDKLYGGEDTEYYIRLYLNDTSKVQCIPHYMYQYRLHPQGITKSPENDKKLLDGCLERNRWVFSHPNLPQEAQEHRSGACMECYRYLARERLLLQQPLRIIQIVMPALFDKNITFDDWLYYGFPLIVRAFCPWWIDQTVVKLRWKWLILSKKMRPPNQNVKENPPCQMPS